MSEQEIETQVEEEVKAQPEPKEDMSSRLMQHLDRQSEILAKKEEELRRLQEHLESLTKKEDHQPDPEDDEPVYLTKKQVAEMENRIRKSVAEDDYKKDLAKVQEQLDKPEINSLANKILEEDEVLSSMCLALHKNDPLKAKQLILKKVNQTMAKRASVPKAPAGASSGSSGNGAPKVANNQDFNSVHSIDSRSTPEQKAAFAASLYNQWIRK